jgi:iron complex transport system substrate-binding protein
LCGCNAGGQGEKTVTITDMKGRRVAVPQNITLIAGGAGIIYALHQQSKLVERGIYGKEAEALARIDPAFAARPIILEVNKINIEQLAGLRPQVYFPYASFNKSEIGAMESAGLTVVALTGETFAESFRAVELVGKVLGCEDKAQAYLKDCRRLLNLVNARTRDIPPGKRLRVMFAGPKSVYMVATGEMLQTEWLRLAGAENVASGLKGFWCDVSPEQVALWNPDVIFLGSSKDTYDVDKVLKSSQFRTVKAVRQRRVYAFPSNIGWWDWPAPHCVLGVLWAAKTLYPQRFTDIDMVKTADEFYAKYLGHSFTALGGKL